jgi:putative intracellular protease/amidase
METKKRKCVLFVFEGFSDWEPSLAVAGLNKFSDFKVVTCSIDGKPVHSMGGLTINPDYSLQDLRAKDIDVLILPGGDAWDQKKNLEVIPLVNYILHQGKLLAAICGATGFLAENGYLDHVRHTSNDLEHYLKHYAPHYKGDDHYIKQHTVLEGNLLTANGTAIVEFAESIFNYFNLLKDEQMNFWFHFFQERNMAIS